MDLAEIVLEKLNIPYAEDDVEDKKGPRLGKRKGKFQVLSKMSNEMLNNCNVQDQIQKGVEAMGVSSFYFLLFPPIFLTFTLNFNHYGSYSCSYF